MFRSKKEIFIEIKAIDNEEMRISTINRIEVLTLQLIEDINSNKFPKLSYSDSRRLADDIPTSTNSASVYQTVQDKQSSGIEEDSPECLSNTPSSIDSSKSLSWVLDEVEDDANEMEAEKEVGVGSEKLTIEKEEADDHLPLSKNSKTVDFKRKTSRRKMILIITVMSHVHKMLINRTTKTRRSLYYELQSELTGDLAPNQRFLDEAVNHVASILDRAPWELGLTATSKGLVYGELSLTLSGQDSINCGLTEGLLIPQNISKITAVRTTARFVLVVEKDAVFQKLLGEDCSGYLNCILITGKGYPDVNTRILVSILGNKLKIPVYVLVDADPFGFEIMCIYRFGSAIRSREVEDLSCPCAKWIGVHPSEFSALGVSPQALTAADRGKLLSLEGRRYVDEKLSEELNLMRKGKVEIEAIAGLSSYRFLTTVYLPRKISANEYV